MKTSLFLIAAVLLSPFCFALSGKLKADKDTCCLISADLGTVTDASGHIPAEKITADGVEFVDDPDFGEVMRFTGGKGITVPDAGKLFFDRGVTLEAWVYLERPVEKKFRFADKFGKDWQKHSFETCFEKGNKFTVELVGFGSEPIDFTEEELVHHWGFRPDNRYGGRGVGSHGNTPLPVGEWVHVAYTYDPARSMQRLWVNGSVDREYFSTRPEWSREIVDEDDVPLRLFERAENIRLAQLRVSPCPRVFGETAPVRVFIHENAYRDQGYVHIKPVRDDLPLPVEIEVMNYPLPEVSKVTLASATEPVNVPIPKGGYFCVESELVVRVRKDGRELWRQESLIANSRPVTGPMSRFVRGLCDWPKDAPKPEWNIEKDNTFTYKGKPIFPLALYFGRASSFDLIADLGFNVISLRPPKGMKLYDWKKIEEPYYAKAAEKGVTLMPDGDVEGRPGQGLWFTFDEPYAYSFERFRQGYMTRRNGRAHPATLPTVASQNNPSRYRETSMCCDVLAPDPYNKGRSPFRNIYDAIEAACTDVDHLKPVICIIANYGTDKFRPDAEDLRTQCYLAVAAGATGLAFYSWDEGEEEGGPMDTALKPDQIASYRKLFREFKELEPALTTVNLETPSVEPAGPRGFFPCLKKGRDGRTYLILCSDLYRSATKRLVIPSAKGMKAKLLFGPDREGKLQVVPEVPLDDRGAGEFSLPPVSTAVYVLEK